MLPLLTVLTLCATPPLIEPWGFSLEVKDDTLIVAEVRPESPAALGEVKVGACLLRIALPAPARRGAVGTLDAESLDDAVLTLREVPDDVLGLELDGGEQGERAVALQRHPFKPKAPDELRAMNPTEMARYYAELSQKMMLRRPDWPSAHFRDEAEAVFWVDPSTHGLLGANGGGASGRSVYARARFRYACVGSRAVSMTFKRAGLASPVVVDLRPRQLQGGEAVALLPMGTVAQVEQCPKSPLTQRFDLELACEQGAPFAGREKLRLAVKCEQPKDFVMPVFTRVEPNVMDEVVTEGTKTVEVRPYFDRSGLMPSSVHVLILDAKGKEVQAMRGAWKAARETDEWEAVRVPAPPSAGKYGVVFEAHWPDGSTSRSARRALVVQTRAEADAAEQEFTARMQAGVAVHQRVKKEGIDLCAPATAIPWLKRQPEVEWVSEPEGGDYTYVVGRIPTLVHCH